MRGNDISNKVAPTVLLDLDLLLEKEEKKGYKGIGEMLVSLFNPPKEEFEINSVMRDKLLRIWNVFDVQIGLFTFDLDWELDEEKLHRLLFKYYVPYNRIVYCVDEMDLRKERFLYIFTDKEDLLSVLSDVKALHIEKLPEVLK